MKRGFKVLAVIGVVCIAIVVGGIAVLKSLDFNEYKGLIAEQVKSATGREVTIAGELNLEISLNPALTVEGVIFANAPWGSRAEMVKLDRLATEVALLPLLSGDIRVKRLVLVGLDVLVETDAKGKGNWEFSAAEKKEEAEGAGEAGLLPVVQKVRMENVRFVYKDGVTGEKLEAVIDALDVAADSASSPLQVSIQGQYNGTPYKVSGRLGPIETLINATMPYAVDLKAVALGADVGLNGSIDKPREVAGLDLTATVKGADLTKTVQAVQALVPALKEINVPDVGPYDLTAHVKGSLKKLAVSELNLKVGQEDRVMLSVAGGIGDAIAVSGMDISVAAKGPDLAATVRSLQPMVPALAEAPIPDLGPYDLAARVKGSLENLSVADIKASVGRAEQLRVTANGGIKDAIGVSGLDLNVGIEAKDLSPLSALAEAPLPDLPPFTMAGRLTGGGNAYALEDLKATVGKSDLSGRVAMSLKGARPVLNAELASTVLDLDELMPVDEKATAADQAAPAGAGDGRVFPNEPLPLDGLKAADATVKFTGKKIVAKGMTVQNAAIDLKLKDGRLEIRPLSAVVSSGQIGGGVLLDSSKAKPVLDIKLNVKQIDYGSLLKQFELTDIASGKADIDVDLTGQGASVRAIMAGLNGRVKVLAQDGKVESGLLNILSADVLSALPLVESKGDKDMRCAVVHFDIKSGQAVGKTILLDTGGISLIGKGKVNLADESLGLSFNPKAKKASVLQAAVPFTVGGTLASPTVVPDLGAVAVGAVKTVTGTVTGIAEGGAAVVGALTGLGGGSSGQNVDETDYCKLALAGKPLVPARQSTAPAPSGEAAPAPTEEKGPAGTVVDAITGTVGTVGEGVTNTLKSLFGN